MEVTNYGKNNTLISKGKRRDNKQQTKNFVNDLISPKKH